jgi:F-type H+-transporting ATPase subunit b
MPQFDFHHVFWPQVAWLAVFFVILYFGIVGPTLPKLGKVVTERENKVTGDIASAETAKATADQLAAEHAAGIASAQDKARALTAEARAKASAAVEARLREANAALDAQAAKAEAELAAARTKAMSEIEGVAADAAATIVEKLTGKRPADAAAATAVRSAMA